MKRLEIYLPWLMAVAGPAILFGPILVRGEVLFWGTPSVQFVPWHQAALDAIRQGHLPLWNPALGMGAPLLANYQSAVLYPPNWLLGLVGPAWGHGLLDMLHLILAGAGMIVLMRRVGARSLGQGIAAVAYSLSGYLVARAGFMTINAATAWLPWVIAATDRLALATPQGRPWRWQASAVLPLWLALAMQWLAGHAQTAWYTFLLAAAWIVYRTYATGRWRRVLGGLVGLAFASLGAFALDCAQLIPTIEYLAQSFRSTGLDPAFAMTYSFWPWRLLGLLTPDLYGNPVRGDFWGYGNYWEDAIYIGVLPLVLALAATVICLRRKGEQRGLVGFLVVSSAVSLLFALGSNTPVFPALFRWVPTFALFQAPTRWSLVMVFSLAVLAGIGAGRWRPVVGKGLYWARLGTAGAAAIGAAAFLGYRLMPGVQPTFVRALAVAGLWLTLAGLLALTRREPAHPAWTALAGLVVLIDLSSAGYGLNPSTSAGLYLGESRLAAEATTAGRFYLPPSIEEQAKYKRAFRFDTFEAVSDWRLIREAGLPNAILLDGLASTNNFDPLLPGRYTTWMEDLARLPSSTRDSLLRLMDVAYAGVDDPAGPLGVSYSPIDGGQRARLVTYAVVVGSPAEALQAVSSASFDPSGAVVVEALAPQPAGGNEGSGSVSIVDVRDPNRVVLETQSTTATWLVLSDTYYPGWRATVDGSETTIYRADYLFRAIQVGEGRHEVEFRYEPLSFRLGAVVSLMAVVSLALLGFRWRRA